MEYIIIAGISIFISFGVIKPIYENYVRSRDSKLKTPILASVKEIILTPKSNYEQKGEKFEKFILQKFDRKYFKILEWRSDKYFNGYYAEANSNPDFELEFKSQELSKQFAVECKFRQYVYKGGITVAKENQLSKYKTYEETKKLKVYIALGIGGSPDNPEEMFIFPLSIVESNFISYQELKPFRKAVSSQFFYDTKKEILR